MLKCRALAAEIRENVQKGNFEAVPELLTAFDASFRFQPETSKANCQVAVELLEDLVSFTRMVRSHDAAELKELSASRHFRYQKTSPASSWEFEG